MANYHAVRVACEAVMSRLESEYQNTLFQGQTLSFDVYDQSDFQSPMQQGVSLFLYRIYINGVQRTLPGRVRVDGQRSDTRLPLDLHVLLTIWAQDVTTQHEIAAWAMRVLEDHPTLTAGFMNMLINDTFQADERVDIVMGDLSHEDMMRMWESLRINHYELSIPYVLRTVYIDSPQLQSTGAAVQERGFDYGKLDSA